MTLEIKEITNETTKAEEKTANAAKTAKRGAARRAQRTADEIAETTDAVVSGNLAERIALNGIRLVRNRARRRDVLGNVLHGGLSLFSTVLGGTARELGKLQRASQPPSRGGQRRSSPARRSTTRRTGRSRRR